MDSHMDIERSDAIDSARESLPTEHLHQVQEEKNTLENNEKLPEKIAESNEPMEDAPPLTSALEALLGGLDPPLIEEPLATNAQDITLPVAGFSNSNNDPMIEDVPITKNLELSSTEIAAKDVPTIEKSSGLLASSIIPASNLSESRSLAGAEGNGEAIYETAPISSAHNAIPGITSEENEQEHPEWEVDSSPIESSSDDSSDDSSSEESEEGENAYKLLSPEEQARILMQDDGGSEDEGGNKSKGSGAQLRTKNEIAEVVIPKPDIIITESMPIIELGAVEAIVENTLLVKANTSGEYRVLENQSILCLQDRSVIGVVSETIGRVQQPFYSVLFTNATEVKEAGLEIGTKVFYSEQHSTYVFTKALKAFKGSDASNLHDEEVGDDEMEFSDDEAEAEHKRKVKQKKMEKRGGTMQQNGGSGRGGHPLRQNHTPYDAGKGLSYDENDDGPYKPLARPVGYAETVGRSEAPQEGPYQPNQERPQSRDQFRGRGRGDRGDRGRGRGDRGRGRGRGGNSNYQDRSNDNSGHSHPSQPQRNFQPPNFQGGPPQQQAFQPYQQPGFSSPAIPQNFFPPQPYSPQQPQIAPWQQMFQQPFPNWPMPPALPGGAYINPTFFNPPPQQPPQQNPGNQNQWHQDQKK